MMTKLIQQILILTILYTLCGGFMLIFRRICVSGSGRAVKRLWMIVMILAVLPLHILPITLPRQVRQQTHFADWLTVHETALADRLAEQLEVGAENDATANPETQKNDATLDQNPVEVSGDADDASSNDLAAPKNRARQILRNMQGIVLAVWLCGAIVWIAKSQYGKWKWLRGLRRFALPWALPHFPAKGHAWLPGPCASARRYGQAPGSGQSGSSGNGSRPGESIWWHM